MNVEQSLYELTSYLKLGTSNAALRNLCEFAVN